MFACAVIRVYMYPLPTQVLIDPGERGSPSGESSPSSTPNSTLGKQIHRHMMENIHAESKHGMGRDGVEDEVKVQHNTTRGRHSLCNH